MVATLQALRVHPEVRLIEGNFPGAGEVMVGRLAWRKLGLNENDLKVGGFLTLENQKMRISGTFAAPGTVLESEIWATLGDLRVLAKREMLSCVVLRLSGPSDFTEADLFAKQRLDLEFTISSLRLEWTHDYIQWLFPLVTRSGFNNHAPLLTEEDRGTGDPRSLLLVVGDDACQH